MPQVFVTIYAGIPPCHPPEGDGSVTIYEHVTGNVSLAAAPAGLELYWVSVYVNGVLAYKGNLAAGDNADFGVDVSGNPGVTVFTARASSYSTRRHRTTRDEDTKTMNPWCDGGGCTNQCWPWGGTGGLHSADEAVALRRTVSRAPPDGQTA